MGTADTLLVVRTTGQPRAKEQRAVAELRSIPIRITSDQNVRRSGAVELVTKAIWLLDVRLRDTRLAPWVLLRDWSAATAEDATRSFQAYRQHWSVEDAFKTTKETLGWEEVQVMDMEAIRMWRWRGWRRACSISWA